MFVVVVGVVFVEVVVDTEGVVVAVVVVTALTLTFKVALQHYKLLLTRFCCSCCSKSKTSCKKYATD